jgi:biopolymer transport protein ExbB
VSGQLLHKVGAINYNRDLMDAIFSFFQELQSWLCQINIVLAVIILCSVVAAAVFFERLIYLKKVEIDTAALLTALKKEIPHGNIANAISICDQESGAVANIVKAGLCKHSQSREHIEHAMELSGMIEIAKMEKNARILSIIAHIAPLIGLLGTVLGFIKAFGQMRLSRFVETSATQIGEAMEFALGTTAAGLVVAIPAVIAYNYIVSRIESMTVEMQQASAEIVDLLESRV